MLARGLHVQLIAMVIMMFCCLPQAEGPKNLIPEVLGLGESNQKVEA